MNINNPENNVSNPLPPFRFWCQTVIPLVYDDSLSYYELLCKVVKQLNDTINAVNNNGSAVTELQQLFVELKDYVDNYFTDLNIQNEINNKLDQMAQDGTLATIINENIFNELNNKVNTKITSVDTYNDLLAYQGSNNELVQTKGYYNINDGGGALYRISTNQETENVFTIKLNNDTYAIMQFDRFNIKQFGCKKGDFTFDNGPIIQSLIDYAQLNGIEIYIPIGDYFVNTPLIITNNLTIRGYKHPRTWSGNTYDSKITAFGLNDKPLFTIASGGLAYDWDNSPNKLVENVHFYDLSIVGYNYNNASQRSITGIYASCYLSSFNDVNVTGFYNDVALAGCFETKFYNCVLTLSYQSLVGFACNTTCYFENLYINNSNSSDPISNSTYIANYPKVTDYHYTCMWLNKVKAYFINLAFEGGYYGIYNLDSNINAFGVNIESISNYAIYAAASLSTPTTNLYKVNWYAPNTYSCVLAHVSYRCYLQLNWYRTFPTRGISSTPYEIADGGIGRIYSDIDGERIVDVPFISGPTNATYINKSHYTNTGFMVDIQVTNYESWNGAKPTQLQIPKCYQTFQYFDLFPSAEKNTNYGLRFNNEGYLAFSDGTWMQFASGGTKAYPSLKYEYQIKNW